MLTPVSHARLRELRTIADKLGQATLSADEVHRLLDEVEEARDLMHDSRSVVRVMARRVGLVVVESAGHE